MKYLSLLLTLMLLGNSSCGDSDTNTDLANDPPQEIDGFEMVWNDEFSGDAIDASKWSYQRGGHGWGNQEEQFYTFEREKNARVENGNLIIEAHREEWEGSSYTSARLRTINKGDWQYGRFEIKARLPEGRGTWPAIWMLPTVENLNWPEDGEIDIMEHVGYNQDVIHGTVHTEAYNHMIGTQKGGELEVAGVSQEFHTYRLDWTAEKIEWFVDDEKYYEFENPGTGNAAWPFDKPFHLIANIAVGGSWGGAEGVATDIWPQRMEIDYIRVYKPSN